MSFDEPNLVANAGLLLVATVAVRLELERLVNVKVHLAGRVGGAPPGRKVLTLVHAMVGRRHPHRPRRGAALGRHGAGAALSGDGPSTLGTFLRAFTFGHVRQLEAVVGEALRRAWSLGGGPCSTLCLVVSASPAVPRPGQRLNNHVDQRTG